MIPPHLLLVGRMKDSVAHSARSKDRSRSGGETVISRRKKRRSPGDLLLSEETGNIESEKPRRRGRNEEGAAKNFLFSGVRTAVV